MTKPYESNMTDEEKELVVDIKQVEAALVKKFDSIEDTMEAMNGQIKDSGKASTETVAKIDKLAEEL